MSVAPPDEMSIFVSFWQELMARPEGPLAFRFVLQPVMAVCMAARDGIADAKSGRLPYLSIIIRDPQQRRERLDEGLHATARILLLAAAMDVVYQLIVMHTVRPLETVVIAFVLGFLPYLIARGPVARVVRRFHSAH
jgi:hypothetical protein